MEALKIAECQAHLILASQVVCNSEILINRGEVLISLEDQCQLQYGNQCQTLQRIASSAIGCSQNGTRQNETML